MDISSIIKDAKLGRSRKDAQVDTCSVFAAALFDVLTEYDIPCEMAYAANDDHMDRWAHSLVKVEGRYYDSLGEFSTDIYRKRSKIHPSVTVSIQYSKDYRSDCYESEFEEMYLFYVKVLKKAMVGQMVAMVA